MKTIKLLSIAIFTVIGLTALSCSSDDSSGGGSSCNDLADQSVRGSFRGESFISPAGFYTAINFGGTIRYGGKIYVKESTNSDCFFPTFDGGDDIILFPLPSLDVQTITLEEFGENTLNFNRIVIEDNTPVTEVELAECGTIEITSYDAGAGILQGTVVAKGQFGSKVNGNFTLLLCDD